MELVNGKLGGGGYEDCSVWVSEDHTRAAGRQIKKELLRIIINYFHVNVDFL